MITERTRLIDVTVGDFVDYLKDCGLIGQPEPTVEYSEPEYVHGLAGLAQLLGCSIGTALKRKQSGEFDQAISQVGRKIIVDANKVLEIARIGKRNKYRR